MINLRNRPTFSDPLSKKYAANLIIACLGFMIYACGNNNSTEPGIYTVDTSTQSSVTDSSESIPVGDSLSHFTGLSDFIPPDYTLLDSAQGDLNLDSFPDIILILRKNGEDSTSDVTEHPEKRPLLILTGQPDLSLRMAAKTENAVYCVNCGGMMGDPYMDVVIKNGYFSVEHYGGSGWRWTRTVTFKYSNPDRYWFLHKDGHESFHAADPEKIRTKIFSAKDFGKVRLEEFDIYKPLDTGLE